MTKAKSTKRALLASGLALFMCISMFVGSTFAWFTDSVKTGVNTIQAGTLDIVLEYKDANGVWQDAEGKTLNFKAADNRTDILWEPGCTYELPAIRVRNNGNLALKYQIVVNGIDGDAKLLEAIKFTANDGAISNFRGELIPGAPATAISEEIVIKGHMKETAGNEYQGLTIEGIGITVFATQFTYEKDSYDNQYDKGAAIYVDSAAEAQAALDNAKKGDVIVLTSGVDYGTLFLRPVDGNANTITSLNEADGEGLTVYRNEYIRTVEDLTILGTTNAKVDAIKVESGYIVGSGSSCNLVDVKGLVIDSVEFTDKADCAPHTYSAPIFFNLTWTDVDGLTVKNCKLIGNDDKVNFVYFTIDGSSAFDGVASNVTLTGNTVDGIARLCELRQTENVTITNNVIKNTVLHGILLPVHNGVYAGNVTITGNTAVGINERFVRMAGAGDANVVIKNNTITDYMGADDDYIKVTDSNGTPVIENNPMTRAYKVSDSQQLQDAISNATEGTVVYLSDGEYSLPTLADKTGITIVGGENTVVGGESASNGFGGDFGKNNTIKNVTFYGTSTGVRWSYAQGGTTVFENCSFLGNNRGGFHIDSAGGATFIFNNCTLSGFNAFCGTLEKVILNKCTLPNNGKYNGLNMYCDLEMNDCTFEFTGVGSEFVDFEAAGKTLTIKNCTATKNGVAIDLSDMIGGTYVSQTTITIDGVSVVK